MAIKIFEGIVTNPGKHRGKVKIIRSLEDIEKINNEDIIVIKNNSPLFSLAFMKAAAIISETGGSLCHLAIVSRELNKPCILGVENALEVFREDMLVEIDAFKNKIIIIENE